MVCAEMLAVVGYVTVESVVGKVSAMSAGSSKLWETRQTRLGVMGSSSWSERPRGDTRARRVAGAGRHGCMGRPLRPPLASSPTIHSPVQFQANLVVSPTSYFRWRNEQRRSTMSRAVSPVYQDNNQKSIGSSPAHRPFLLHEEERVQWPATKFVELI